MAIQRSFNRRRFLTGAALAAGTLWLPVGEARAARRRPRAGVAIGAISYSFRELPGDAARILDYLVECRLDCVELMGEHAEAWAGAPALQLPADLPGDPSRATPDQVAAIQAALARHDEQARQWRKGADVQAFHRLRKLYDDAGVRIDILKLGAPSWSDAELDYACEVARILGARGLSCEAGEPAARRVGAACGRHHLVNGMHNHAQYADAAFDPDALLALSPANRLNFDVGHYVGSTGRSPVEFIRRHHERISHLHLKDRRSPANGGANVPWGEGDTPLGDVLRLLRDQRWPISAMIELEYPVPAGSSVLAEVRRCGEYCRQQLA